MWIWLLRGTVTEASTRSWSASKRRFDGLTHVIPPLYAKGMTVRDSQHHLQSRIGSELPHETISNITKAVAGR